MENEREYLHITFLMRAQRPEDTRGFTARQQKDAQTSFQTGEGLQQDAAPRMRDKQPASSRETLHILRRVDVAGTHIQTRERPPRPPEWLQCLQEKTPGRLQVLARTWETRALFHRR